MGNDVRFDVRENLRDIVRKFESSTREQVAAALPRALNRTLTTTRAAAARLLGKGYPGMKAATLKRQIKFTRASKALPTAVLTFSGRRFRLYGNFNVRTRNTRYGTGVPQGARLPANLLTGDNRPVSGADAVKMFLARSGRNGRPNFWLRLGRDRMPITVVVVRGLAGAYVQEKIDQALIPIARDRFVVAITQELKFRTGA